ncbi:MAG TPA: ATP-dependent protease ATPase subunit HslU [Chloroflexota bacterium]|nr:ATP-dependent protease ATPase subunit HslU [Chloroflexota bacterium]
MNTTDLTPQEIVKGLDRYIVGQEAAKRSLAVALRERERRKRLGDAERAEIGSKNILIIGPTGVGKTELARRLARMVDAPFLRTEATKFTEVGYVGRDVESIVRDLADASVSMVHRERMAVVKEEAERLADERIVSCLVENQAETETGSAAAATERSHMKRRRRAIARKLAAQELEERLIEIEVDSDEGQSTMLEFVSGIGSDEVQEQFQELMNSMNATRSRSRRLPVREARRVLVEQEMNKLIDFEEVVETAIRRVEESGIVFLDEIDKLVNRGGGDFGADVSGEGVQRDLLPIVEGATVATRYGMVNTDHILFIGAGAFNRSRPSDLLPELQGRFPIRVEVSDLSVDDFVRILVEPDNSPLKQYSALLATEGVTLEFSADGVREIARLAAALNAASENLGARRLYGVLERVLESISFSATELSGQTVTVDRAYVAERMAGVPFTDEMSKYIL